MKATYLSPMALAIVHRPMLSCGVCDFDVKFSDESMISDVHILDATV